VQGILRVPAAILLSIACAYGQPIFTTTNPNITTSDSLNFHLRSTNGYKILIREPRVMNRKGYRVRNGFTDYYLYVVRSTNILVEQHPIENHGLKAYLVVYSDKKKMYYDPDSIGGRCLYLLGMIDTLGLGSKLSSKPQTPPQTNKKTGCRLLSRLRGKKQATPEGQTNTDSTAQARPSWEAQQRAAMMLAFKQAKDRNRLLAFFRSKFYYSQSPLYNLESCPYGLPYMALEDKKRNRTETVRTATGGLRQQKVKKEKPTELPSVDDEEEEEEKKDVEAGARKPKNKKQQATEEPPQNPAE
jgi:hypothetical protein